MIHVVPMSLIDSSCGILPTSQEAAQASLDALRVGQDVGYRLACSLRPTGKGRFTTTARNQHLFRLMLTLGYVAVEAYVFDPEKLLETEGYENYR